MFQGNNVKDEAADVALFAELGSSPANMEAGKALDAYGSMPGNRTSQGDGKQAYAQALMQGILTWIRLQTTQKQMAQRMDWGIQRSGCSSYFGIVWSPRFRGVYGNVIVRRHCTQSDFILFIQNAGRQCFGILS